MVKHLPTMRVTWLQSLGWEDLPEKEMATYSSILAWKIPWTVEPGRLPPTGSQSRTRLSNFSFSLKEGFCSQFLLIPKLFNLFAILSPLDCSVDPWRTTQTLFF